ncbi:MAG: hypothetical protein KDC52_13980, partial [Ignavibacteriae bacterium]|nr:hypothetical protein [Ignavibacteriota bacterium]
STFYGLRGYEDLDGNTHLFFDIGSSIKYDNEWGNYDSKSSITHYNIHNNIDSSFLSSYSFDFEPISREFDVVTDFELWSISPINFIKCGTSGVTTSKAYLEINHRPIIFPNFSSSTNNIEISNLNDSILYIDIEGSPSGIYKSIDGGYNWNYLDSTNEQSLISVSKNQLNVIFTTDKYGYLMKSIDDCKTFILADSNLDKKYNIDNLNRFFLYDSDSSHIYRVIENQNIFKLVVSDSVGELGTWREVFQSDRNIFISHNPSKSGEIYFANNKEIYKSENYGETYNLVLELKNTISGIYKKSNSDLLYATTPHKLLEINSDSIKILKQLIDYEALSYYPMHVGDYWEYQVTMRGEGQYDNDDWVGYKRVIGDSVLSNNKKYFIVQSNRLGTQNNDAIET